MTIVEPNTAPTSLKVVPYNSTSINISWTPVDCHKHNGRLIGYIVRISNTTTTLNISSNVEYVITSDVVFNNVYNMSVAMINSIGMGPFSMTTEVEIMFG